MLPGIERMQWFRNNIWSQEAQDEEAREIEKMDTDLKEMSNQPLDSDTKSSDD